MASPEATIASRRPRPAPASAAADALFALADPVLRGLPRWVLITHRDVTHVFMVHGQCCMAYKAPDHGYCTSCPFTTDDERECRLRSWLDEQPVPGATT